ncbi:MAG TPA: SMP-30/gluconolactonase/LRE family protein [Pirellulales bacterium]|nr:SMP-30/gluconolactonase/LRE family protein [Pirellulales bacterium]
MSCSVFVRHAVACRLAVLTVLAVASRPAAGVAEELLYPLAIATRGDQTIFLADRDLPGVWQADGSRLRLFFQGEKKFRTPLNAPRSLAVDGEGRLLAGDSATREVYRFSAEGKPEPLTKGGIGIPMGIAVNRAGDLLVSDLELHTIWKVPGAGGEPAEFARVSGPGGVCIDAKDRLWVVSRAENGLLRVSPEGKVETIVKGRAFEFPHAVAVDKASVAYVCDGYAKTIWKVDAAGKPEKWAANPAFVNPVGLAWRGETLLVVDSRAKAVFQVDSEGEVTPFELKPGE